MKNLRKFNIKLENGKYKNILLILIFSLTFQVASATEKDFTLGKNKINLHYPKGWQHAFNFLNTPLTLFGPVLNGRRAVVSINNTNIKDFSFNKKDLQDNEDNYKNGRLKWLKKNKGKVVRFTGYRISKWKNIPEIHSIGYSYTIKNDLFLEKSYFFNCNNELFNISTLMTWEQNKSHGKEVKKILSSFKCLK
ncbi:putative exported protein [Halobacteriovorax marinus SJ]|uniref:Exported protein n=1 Tax=Halobacteriovorax marinus (strain ATCC BAA-682 / DSM 15412 / SJ) TaxID=862908 RepID=E1WYS6_HALMS|nr:hypothetical protein [Halobacteriovorax marinus]CBW27716.1 putative exported protein [Halobacteriovorax marinus SJ]